MNSKELAQLFRDKGFGVIEYLSDDISVYLNRPISFQEVLIASNGEVEEFQLERITDCEIGISLLDDSYGYMEQKNFD